MQTTWRSVQPFEHHRIFTILFIAFLFLTILPVPDHTLSGDHQTSDAILIETPGAIPVRSPFMIFVSLNLSDEVRLKASLNSMNGRSAARFWNGSHWIYPGGSWDSMLSVPGNFKGYLYLNPHPSYSGHQEILQQGTGTLNITARSVENSDTFKESITILPLDTEGSSCRMGFSISGRIYQNGSALEGAFVTLESNGPPQNNTGYHGFTAFYTSESNNVSDDNTGKGSFHLWGFPGNYSLKAFRTPEMEVLVYETALWVSENVTINLGDFTPPTGVCINEIFYDPDGNETAEEFVELFNYANISIDLTGWSLSDQDGETDFTFPGLLLQPHTYVVLHTGPGIAYQEQDRNHYYLNRESSFLTNTGDDLVLTSNDGSAVDYIAWGSGNSIDDPPMCLSWEGTMESGEGRSLSLIPDGNDTDSATNWIPRTPTPGYSNVYEEPNKSEDNNTVSDPYHPMITQVYYNTYGGGDEEYIALHNQDDKGLDLSGWSITDGESVHVLSDIHIFPGDTIFLARSPKVFFNQTSIQTNHSYFLSLGDERDSVSLLDTQGNTVDAVSWGGEKIPGWSGDLPGSIQGQVIRRNRVDGLFQDTDYCTDWESHRLFMIGQSELPFHTMHFTGQVTPFVSPDSSFSLIHKELTNASDSINLNVYELTNFHLMQDLLDARNRSVHVTVLLEGGPVGGISDTGLYIAHRLSEAGARVLFLHNNDTVKDRYNYDHAKYVVIDHDTLIIDSENWKSSGIPVDPSYGNRGWGIAVYDETVAGYFEDVFAYDSCTTYPDVVSFGNDRYQPPENFTYDPEILPPSGSYYPVFFAEPISGEFEITPVIAPDHTIREDAIIGMINKAQRTVFIQQLQCHISWAEGLPNIYLEAAIRASERGCDVRILLDSRYVNIADDDLDNADTVDYINGIALSRGLDNLCARLAVLSELSKIHNKGVIVDEEFTLVSSINWGKGAALLNREAGIIIRNSAVAEYFTTVFLYDWDMSTGGGPGGYDNSTETTNSYYMTTFIIILGVILGMAARKRSA